MKIAWVTHQLPSSDDAENGLNLLPGKFPGGAELSNHLRIEASPDWVEVTQIHSRDYRQAFDYDAVIVGATDLLSDQALFELAELKPSVALTHLLPAREGNRVLFEKAKVVIAFTPAHLQACLHDYKVQNAIWNLTPVDISKLHNGPKQDFALHAARREAWKGLDNAQAWALQNNVDLIVMQREPREKVLEAMSRAKYFVHLPHILDAEPSSATEAVISGCQMIVNENVGLTSVPNWDNPDALAELVSRSAAEFWSAVVE